MDRHQIYRLLYRCLHTEYRLYSQGASFFLPLRHDGVTSCLLLPLATRGFLFVQLGQVVPLERVPVAGDDAETTNTLCVRAAGGQPVSLADKFTD